MIKSFCGPLVLLSIALSGCSVHPLPEDVSRKSTFDIVKRMRCEIKHGSTMSTFPPDVRLSQVSVGFDFTFQILEESNAGDGKLKFVNPVSGGSFSLDFAAAVEKDRNNTRTFRVVDTLERIATDDCSPEWERANFVYPIAGRIGLDEMVVTFARIRGLTGFKKIGDSTTDVFTDKLEFFTLLRAGVTPTLKIEAGKVGSLELTDYSINGNVRREDKHTVTVVIGISDEKSGATPPPGKGRARDLDDFDDEVSMGARENDIPAARPGPTRPVVTSSATSKVIAELDRQRYLDDLREFPLLSLGLVR